MICNKCGAKNSDTRVKCFHCGSPITATGVNPPSKSTEEIKKQPTPVIKKRVEEIKKQSTTVKKESVDETKTESFEVENIYTNNFDDDIEQTYTDDDITETEETTTYTPDDLSGGFDDETDTTDDDDTTYNDDQYEDSTQYDDEFDDEEYGDDEFLEYEDENDEIAELSLDETTEQHFKLAYKKKSHGFVIAIWILALVFIIAGIFIGTLIYQYLNTDDGVQLDPIKDTVTLLDLSEPTVSKQKDSNGKEYVHAIFTGTPGDRLHLKCNNTYHTFVTGTIELDLYLEDLFDREYEFKSNVITANMNAYYLRNGKEYAYNADAFQMSVPEAELVLNNTEQEIKVYSDKYALEFWTATDAKVELNYKNITEHMNSMGNFKYELSVLPDTVTTYSLEVRQPYHTKKSTVIIVKRDALPISLTIASNNAESHSEKTLTLNINTNENASISASLPIIETVPNLLKNSYEITLDLSSISYGETEILITAATSEGSSTKAFKFLYWPDEDTITKSANKFTTAVATNSANYVGRNYVIPSVTVTKNAGANKFEGTCELNSVKYTLIIDNTDISKNIIIGSSYKIFAECTGKTENGAPVFRAWFIYNA